MVLLLPVVLLKPANVPKKVLLDPVVFKAPALTPTNELAPPVVLLKRWPRAHANLASYYTEKGMYDEALAEIQGLPGNLNPIFLGPKALLGRIYAKQGRRAEAMKILGEFEELSKQRYITPVAMARLYASLGYKDEAFAWVQKAYEERSWYLRRINVDPTDAELRSDPRVADLLRRAGLSQ